MKRERERASVMPRRPDVPDAAEMEQRYIRLLSNFYDQIYDLDFRIDFYRSVYQSDGKFCAPPEGHGLAAMLEAAADTLIHPEDKADFQRLFQRAELRRALSSTGGSTGGEYRKKCLDGSYRWVRVMVFPFGGSGQERYLVCFQDIDVHKHVGASTRENVLLHIQSLDHLRYRAIAEQTRSMVFEWQGPALTYVDALIPRLLAGNYDGRHLFELWREDKVLFSEDRAVFENFLRSLADSEPSSAVTMRLRRRTGAFTWYVLSCTRLENNTDEPRYMCSLRDVDKAIHIARSLRQQAEYDDLTGACTMPTFLGKTGRLRHKRPDALRHIVRYDVAGFRAIDERFGQEEGRRLLRAISYLTRENLASDRELFARLSGDIFLVCLEGGSERVREFMDWLRRGVAEYANAYRPELFFGACRLDDPETPVREICERAYLALMAAKGRGLSDHAFYDDELRRRVLEEHFIKAEMYAALADGQFVPYLQPKVEIFSGRIVGAEALARWRHPERGLIPPNRFVPFFERNGFIVLLDKYIWEEVCKLLRSWLDKGYRPVPVSINVSRLHFSDNSFCEKLRALTDKYRLPRHLLELELTESAFFENEKILQQTMRDLQESGFAFSMDDFGTGYSSLNTLRALPFNTVKLDRAFVSDGTDNRRGRIVARNTITLAKQLGMKIIAEGVETVEQALFLRSLGCDHAQGFYYSRPMDARDFETFSFVRRKCFWVDPRLQETLPRPEDDVWAKK